MSEIPSSVYSNIPFVPTTSVLSPTSFTIALMHNFYDDNILHSSSNYLKIPCNQVILNAFGTDTSANFLINGQDVSGQYLNSDGSFKMNYFLNLFYSSGLNYNVSPDNGNNAAIVLNSQTFTTGNSTSNKFNLYNFLLNCYLDNKGFTLNNIDPRILMLLRKETMKINSLSDIRGTTIASSWDAVITNLIDNVL